MPTFEHVCIIIIRSMGGLWPYEWLSKRRNAPNEKPVYTETTRYLDHKSKLTLHCSTHQSRMPKRQHLSPYTLHQTSRSYTISSNLILPIEFAATSMLDLSRQQTLLTNWPASSSISWPVTGSAPRKAWDAMGMGSDLW